ncbi:hypothetical protein [Moritella viscosa]|uniref:hypothetical protein n=1 Tax=Moritella viscosa TaxID=80854 RepID=UPI00094D60A4|nr:hypothetical protein [Moritella viscosa]
MQGQFCTVKGFKPSARTLAYVADMNNVVEMSTLLGQIIKKVPIFQIFAGRNTYAAATFASMGYNVWSYDWSLLQNSFKSIGLIRQGRLRTIALSAAESTSGEERKFWRCTYNAL